MSPSSLRWSGEYELSPGAGAGPAFPSACAGQRGLPEVPRLRPDRLSLHDRAGRERRCRCVAPRLFSDPRHTWYGSKHMWEGIGELAHTIRYRRQPTLGSRTSSPRGQLFDKTSPSFITHQLPFDERLHSRTSASAGFDQPNYHKSTRLQPEPASSTAVPVRPTSSANPHSAPRLSSDI